MRSTWAYSERRESAREEKQASCQLSRSFSSGGGGPAGEPLTLAVLLEHQLPLLVILVLAAAAVLAALACAEGS